MLQINDIELDRARRRTKNALEELKRVCDSNLEKLNDKNFELSDMRYMTSNALHELAIFDFLKRNVETP